MKSFKVLTAFILILSLFVSGCSTMTVGNDKISVVCTNFPVYDWVTEIVDGKYSDEFDVILLGGNGDLHSYQPTAQDIATVQTCDLFVYVGGVSDGWTEAIFENNDIEALRLFDVLKDDLICGNHEHDEHQHKDEEYDEHIWLSPVMAKKAFDAVSEKLIQLMPEAKEVFSENAERCRERFDSIDEAYRNAVEESDDKTVVFADRFPFVYLTEEYGIDAVAAFRGCSADADAGFEVIAQLAEAVDSFGKKTVLVLENSNETVAKTVIDSTKNKDVEIAVMNSCQTIDKNATDSYFEIMESNLEALKKALE